MYCSLTKSFSFESAHFLPSFPDDHKCRRLHGHSFQIDVTVSGELPQGSHHLIDYAEISAAIAPVKDALDHRLLNEIEGLEHPTSERIAEWIWDRLSPVLAELSEIVVHETCTSRCAYSGPGRGS
jgi:6-pyruvoyltetrahydropterin/6-carboxytetrahydropterin synthase